MKVVNLYEKPKTNWPVIGLLAFVILLLSGCKTAQELLDKAEKKDPAIVAKLARDKYPCTELLKNDTAVIWKDTTIYIDCPDTVRTNDFEIIKYDTINKTVVKTIRVPVNMPVRTQVITKWYEDSAKLKIAAVNSVRQLAEIEKLQAQRDMYRDKSDHRGKENWIWRVIATILICWQVFKLLKRFKIL